MYEQDTHHFIVKVWLEAPAIGKEPAIWRGHVTHVASGEQHYVTSLADISGYIGSYLIKMGIDNAFKWPQ
jgi:hypothetical protein